MQLKQASKSAHLIACALASCVLSATAVAAPYAISHTGTISNSSIPGVNNGEPYTVTVVMDNGGGTTVNQTWAAANVTCVKWTMNTAANVTFNHDVTLDTLFSAGQVQTDGAGVLTANFSELDDSDGVQAGSYSATGLAIVDPTAEWYLNEANGIFTPDGWTTRIDDPLGGVQMDIASWSHPQPFLGGCLTAPAPAPMPTAIPTLSEWGMILLSSLLALGAIFTLRRKRQ